MRQNHRRHKSDFEQRVIKNAVSRTKISAADLFIAQSRKNFNIQSDCMTSNLNLITSHKNILSLYDSDCVFCAFDTESTGIDVKNECIIEIGAVKFTKHQVLEEFSSLVKPKKQIPEEIEKLTGITNTLVKDADEIEKVLLNFRKFIQETVLIAHNAQFDLRLIQSESARLGLFPVKNEAVDTLRLSRIMLPKNKSWKISHFARQLHTDVSTSHRALDDAKVCKELFEYLLTLPVPKRQRKTKKYEENAR